jgi:hypothetical protein
MRRVLPFVLLLCAAPMITDAQQRVIVGNTLMDLAPGYTVVADAGRGSGKGHGRGAPSPAPSVSAPAPAPAPSFSGEQGRGESGFTYRVQAAEGAPVLAQLPAAWTPLTVLPIPPGTAGGSPGCCAPYATLTIPVQLHQASPVPASPPLPGARQSRECPAGCMPSVGPAPPPPVPPSAQPRVCNTAGQCIPWP